MLEKLARKDKVMGFGHAVYSVSDPRNTVIKQWSQKLAQDVGNMKLYEISEAIEKVMWDEKKLFPNLDFYSASAVITSYSIHYTKLYEVIARFASHPVAGNAANDPTSLPAYEAVARHLIEQGKD